MVKTWSNMIQTRSIMAQTWSRMVQTLIKWLRSGRVKFKYKFRLLSIVQTRVEYI